MWCKNSNYVKVQRNTLCCDVTLQFSYHIQNEDVPTFPTRCHMTRFRALWKILLTQVCWWRHNSENNHHATFWSSTFSVLRFQTYFGNVSRENITFAFDSFIWFFLPLGNQPITVFSGPLGLIFTWWGCCGWCLWYKPTELAHSFFYSVLAVFVALSTVFHSTNSSDNSPLSHSVLSSLSLPYWSFQLYVSFWKSSSALM